MARNLHSISGKEGIVWDKVKKELELGRITGPFWVLSKAWLI